MTDVVIDDADVAAGLTRAATKVETALETLIPQAHGYHARVLAAMRYALFAGGKRLRPYLTLAGAALFDVPQERALRAAAAIEALHTYSLVHDGPSRYGRRRPFGAAGRRRTSSSTRPRRFWPATRF